jgi:S1-C subfamily serine protease
MRGTHRHDKANVGRQGHGLAVHETVTGPEGEGRAQLVIDAVSDGPGALAGLRPGDVLLEIGGRPVGNRFDLERAFWDYKGGEIAAVGARQGREVALTLTHGGAGAASLTKGN